MMLLQNDASALIAPFWQGVPGGSISYTMNDGGVDSGTIVIVNFTDNTPGLYAGNGLVDKITVTVNSTSDPVGIPLTLTEDAGDTGQFGNTNLIFTNGAGLFDQSHSQSVSLDRIASNTDPNVVDEIISNSTSGLEIVSSSDDPNTGGTGIFLNLTETNQNTHMFSNTLHFTSGSSINGSSIKVRGGDIVTLINIFNFDLQNELVTPNPDPGLGALPAQFGDTISIVYNGMKSDASITSGTGPGGGGGGLILPSVVLDAVVGGSTYIVQPPSFGGASYHFSDGLTFTQGKNKTTFDISHYNQDLQRQVMIAGEKVNMTFKTFEGYKVDGVVHMALYIIPRGEDMITSNSIASIEWDKGKPVVIHDLGKILQNANVYSGTDSKFQHTTFSFVPAKSYDKMSFLARAWNDHMYTTDVRVHDAVETPPHIKTFSPGVFKYDNFAQLQEALYKDHFYKPEILAHIHDTNSVFPELNGNVYWLYDTNEHSVTLVVSDSGDNELFEHKGLLQPYEIEKKGDYGFMYFTTKQLNRLDIEQMKKAIEIEQDKAQITLQENKIIRISKW